MKKILFMGLMNVSLLSFLAPLAFGELVYVCNSQMRYSDKDIDRAYNALLDEPHVFDNLTLKKEHLEKLHLTEKKYQAKWSRLFFKRGLNPPKVLSNDQQVLEFVAANPQGVGYVHAFTSYPGVVLCGLPETKGMATAQK